MQLLYKPTTAFFGMYSKEKKTYIYTKSCTQMFIVVLLKMAKNWQQTNAL